jgi:hypothetical protein
MNDVNFIPGERLAAKRRKARTYVWAIVCGTYIVLLVAGSLAAYVVCPRQDTGLTQQLVAAEEQIKQNNKTMAELRRTLAQTTAGIETARAIYEQPDWSRLLTGLSHRLGPELVLSRCRLAAVREDGKSLTDPWTDALLAKPLRTVAAKHRYQLVLQGFGQTQESVSQFALGLEEIGLFDRVRLMNSSRQTFLTGQAVAFTIECSF